jgi:hypothetical protein
LLIHKITYLSSNPSLSANSSASVDDGCISPPQNQRGVSLEIRPILRGAPLEALSKKKQVGKSRMGR